MSDSQTPYPEAAPRSLPYCLQHASRADALDSAKCLALFLEEATESLFSCQNLSQPEAIYGMTQCFVLLRDKLDIASGDLAGGED